MLKLNPSATAAIERAIESLELKTRAEVVVSIRGQSAEYRDVPWMVGSAAALAVLAVVLWRGATTPGAARPWRFAAVGRITPGPATAGGVCFLVARLFYVC